MVPRSIWNTSQVAVFSKQTSTAANMTRQDPEPRRGMTDGEKKLRSKLEEFRRLYGPHARAKTPAGPFVVDLVIQSKNGALKVEHRVVPDNMAGDARRDARSAGEGYRFPRFTAGELSASFDRCIEETLCALGLKRAAR